MVKFEFYRLFYNKFTLGLLLLLSICIQISGRFKPDLWLFFACVLVGQTIAEGFTDGNLRNEIMAIQNRNRLILWKTASTVIFLLIFYVLNSCVLFARSGKDFYICIEEIGVIGYQLLLIETQLIFLVGVSLILKNYSGTAIVTMGLFVIYHVCEAAHGGDPLAAISEYTYLKLYSKIYMQGALVDIAAVAILFALGMVYFKKSDL